MTEQSSPPSSSADGLTDEDVLEDDADGALDDPGAVEGTGHQSVRLSDGSGVLIVEGPGSGSVVAEGDAAQATATAAPIPSRDEALAGPGPLMILHRPKDYAAASPRLLANIHAAFGANLSLGVSSRLSSCSEQANIDFHDRCGAASVRIVDPEGCYVGTGDDLVLGAPSALRVKRAPHLGGAATTVADYLDMQRQRGANLLLTPGRNLDRANAQTCLDAICADGDAALAALQPGERLALNLPISSHWLKNPALRDALLGQLLDEQQFDTWYVRVQLPLSVRSEAQSTDAEMLRGYRRLAELAVDEERQLIAAQSGLTGWFMLGFGATAFGTGQSGTQQAFREEGGGGGGGYQRIERYFERQLLQTIERTSRAAVVGNPAYVRCDCPYCPALLRPGAAWSHEYAGLHQVFNTARLAATLDPAVAGPGGSAGRVRRIVRAAVRFAAGKVLTETSDPKHLQVWDQVL